MEDKGKTIGEVKLHEGAEMQGPTLNRYGTLESPLLHVPGVQHVRENRRGESARHKGSDH